MLLCELVEDGIVKCERYWPDDSMSRLYADVTVTLTDVTSFSHFVVRTFHVVQLHHSAADGDVHTVTQYQFTAWPPHGLPRHPVELLEFHANVSTGASHAAKAPFFNT